LLLLKGGPVHEIGDPGLVLDGDEHHPLGRAGLLTDQDESGDPAGAAVLAPIGVQAVGVSIPGKPAR
jgi:hypothetical protein